MKKLVIEISDELYRGIKCRNPEIETEYVCDNLMKAVDKSAPYDDLKKLLKQLDNLHIETRPISPEQQTKFLFYNMAVDDCIKVVRANLESVKNEN